MDFQKTWFYVQYFCAIARFIAKQPILRLSSLLHRYTYRLSSTPQNVVVIGGSFTGALLVKRLAHTLPSGYRVILVEKRSHMHYAFAFPRNAVFSGREDRALIPYDNLTAGAPAGIYQRIQDEVSSITESHVGLSSGGQLEYDFLILATGTAQPSPTRLEALSWNGAVAELRDSQQQIKDAKRIAVIGGGGAGIEMVTEIRAKYPDKHLSLVHSKARLLPRFGPKLHSYVLDVLQRMDIDVILRERLVLPVEKQGLMGESEISLSTGETRTWDLIIRCTGLRPQSDMLASFAPKSVAHNGEILVRPTLQVDKLPLSRGNIFALGDVARTGGPKQGRAGMMQGEVVLNNILRLIQKRNGLQEYHPLPFEGTLYLTLGKNLKIMYIQQGDFELLQENKPPYDEDVGAADAWKAFHAEFSEGVESAHRKLE
ncbi:FAD/NAD(P)-binding domain-containing protein [Aspergillus tamarii]|uniref:FAD/NAD(P)-binding domain-containing protein n=1 Tax=Aspergillus tamarii TaxID=41984 RepID=A0A5N6V517_ASPTM|nr:FAD/NAD(P)-binding domain-containing protein [Aspergillus tamarii]